MGDALGERRSFLQRQKTKSSLHQLIPSGNNIIKESTSATVFLADDGPKKTYGALGEVSSRRDAQASKTSADVPAKIFVRPKLIIDPRSSRVLPFWDGITMLALVYTALFTPYEVAFMGSPPSFTDEVFLLNRAIDFVFLVDSLLQFFLATAVSDKFGDRWITNHYAIMVHYLKGWFLIDVVSIAVSSIDFLLVTGDEADKSQQALAQFKVLRVVRVFRLLKLVRIARSSRLIARWETQFALNYGLISLMRAMLSILLFTHWFGCLWMLGASFTGLTPAQTWLEGTACVQSDYPAWKDQIHEPYRYRYVHEPPHGPGTGWSCTHPFRIYGAATYWSAMTITSIGYGDITATPGNTGEQFLCTLIMLLGAMVWGNVVATFCSVMASMGGDALKFRENLDRLNDYVKREKLPYELRQRLALHERCI
jgi:hypothetical protein